MRETPMVMAHMIPDITIEEVEAAHSSAAEAKVYAALRDLLDDHHTVLHSVAWLERDRTTAPVEGEADFVILHPRRGLLVVEVKGGAVERDPFGAGWISRDGSGVTHRLTDPYEQAKSSRHALLRKLQELPAPLPPDFTDGHVVIFADVFRAGALLGPDATIEISLFADDLPTVDEAIRSAFKYWTPAHPERGFGELGPESVEMIVSLLVPALNLEIALGSRVQDDALRVAVLTERQSVLLGTLRNIRRARITGGAGTGKTALAVEKAKQLASEGFETLLVCFNRLLAEELAARCKGIERLTVRTFHDHCVQMVRDANIPLPELDGDGAPSQDFWDARLPELLVEALDALPDRRFDAVVADEGQDFDDSWWSLIELCFRDQEATVLYVFEDPVQAIFRDASSVPTDLPEFSVNENLRNTQTIHEAASVFYEGDTFIPAGPVGEPVEYVSLAGDDRLPTELSRVLHRLTVEEHVRPEDIVVLSARSRQSSVLAESNRIGAFELVEVGVGAAGRVEFDSVWRFKGLERPVAVLVEFAPETSDQLRYTALTRATSHAVIIGTPDMLAKFRRDEA